MCNKFLLARGSGNGETTAAACTDGNPHLLDTRPAREGLVRPEAPGRLQWRRLALWDQSEVIWGLSKALPPGLHRQVRHTRVRSQSNKGIAHG